MAEFSTVCVFLGLLLSSCLKPGCCQYYQLIDLTSPSSGVTCSMDSIYSSPSLGTSLNCTGAINGNTTTKWSPTKYQNPNCVYTSYLSDMPYWQVDLGQTRNIHRIIIYPETIWEQYMKGITVFVDNTQVFQFPTSSPDNPQVITPDPPLMGSVIKLEQTTGRYRYESYVTLCELQVYGCVSDRYGARCQETCTAGCQSDTCDSITGNCTCRTGWSPPQCQVCSSDYYRQGDNCVPCGAGCQAGTCRDNGECDCRTTNWQSPLCQTCKPGYYGTNCDMECSAGCDDTCNPVSGTCTCTSGWTGPKCDVCADGYYGASCRETCSTGCRDTCNKQDGTCNCRTGWSGDRCDECSDDYYHNTTALDSSDCQKCGDGCVTTSCDDVTGRCTCRPGWQESTCQECAPGQFGDDCQHTCSVGCENICDLNTGSCTCRQGWVGPTCEMCATDYYNKSESGVPTPGDCIPCGSGCSDTCDGQSGYCTCLPGWKPPFCDQVCEANLYGQNCSSSCAPGCDGTCDAVIGNCTCGPQWIQPDCTVCSPGYYSPDEGCKPCSTVCENVTSCDPTTGACQACSPGFYGDACFSPCTNCAGNGICSKQMGECETGCVEGWTGPTCAQPLKTGGGDNGSTNTAAIVGAVLGAGVFIGIIVGALLIIRARRSRASSQSEQFNGNMTSSVQETETAVDFPGESDTHNEAAASEQVWDDSNNYDMLRSYENSDDIKPYTSLQTNLSSTHGPDALNPAPRDTGVYEIPDVVYENTRTDNLT